MFLITKQIKFILNFPGTQIIDHLNLRIGNFLINEILI